MYNMALKPELFLFVLHAYIRDRLYFFYLLEKMLIEIEDRSQKHIFAASKTFLLLTVNAWFLCLRAEYIKHSYIIKQQLQETLNSTCFSPLITIVSKQVTRFSQSLRIYSKSCLHH